MYIRVLLFLLFQAIPMPYGWRLTPLTSPPSTSVLSNSRNRAEPSDLKVSGSSNQKYSWPLGKIAFSLLPLYPNNERRTLCETIIPNKIWTFDQIQGVFNVNVPVRCVVIKLKEGGLFVYNPVAPTLEFVEMMKKLEDKHGSVKYIILGTVGLEHKAFLGSFSRYFPKATVYIQPGQWSFPLDIPSSFLGFPLGKRVRPIPTNKTYAPWMNEFDYSILGPLRFKSVGGFSETAFFHKETKTLLVTDAIVKVGDKPPPILELDPRALLYHSRDEMLEEVEDTPSTRIKGWKRMAIFGLTFFPSGITLPNPLQTLLNLRKVSKEAKSLGKGVIPISGGLYPWKWIKSEELNFQSLQGGIFVAPILTEIIFNREPDTVLAWAKEVSKWPIQRIIPSHLENNIIADSQQFLNAFLPLKRIAKESIDTKSTAKFDAKEQENNRVDTTPFFSKLFASIPLPKLSEDKSKPMENVRNPKPLDSDLQFLRFLSELFSKYGIN